MSDVSEPGENPLHDLLHHGKQPFPADIASMLYQINGLNPGLLRNLRDEPHAWARGENLDEGRKVLHHWVKISSF